MASSIAGLRRRHYLIVLAIAALLITALVPASLRGSSHREAPLIAKDPTADNTDLYAYVTPDEMSTVTIIANFIPVEEPTGGPYFHNFDDNVLYEIKVDNDGDAIEDLTYQFRFTTTILNPDTFLYNTGPITSLDDPDFNFRQHYTVTLVEEGKAPRVLNTDNKPLPVPPANVGPRSTPDYAALADAAQQRLRGGIEVFAGPRDDPFFVDIGSIFDLGGLRPFNPAHLIPLDQAPGIDSVGGFNVHTIALQVPRSRLGEGGNKNDIVGIYATASRQTTTVLNGDGTVSTEGDWQQVSRLGNPLINEVVIPVGMKDLWNASDPADDAQFLASYETPELAALVNLLYPSLPDARTTDRADLVAILLTGLKLPDGSDFTFTGETPADLLRLNMGIPPCDDDCSTLGVLGGDLAGFPNGRRLTDDITDIELRAIADGYGPFVNSLYGDLTPNNEPNNDIGDGVNENDLEFMADFPYLAQPYSGYEHEHHRVGSTTPVPL